MTRHGSRAASRLIARGAATALGLMTLGLLAAAPAAAEDELPAGHPPVAAAKKANPHGAGVRLPGDIRLGGRFDVAYERHSYTDDLTEGRDAFRNYHRFVFLSRFTKDDPFFFNAEILGLNFYEMGVRLKGEGEEIWRASLTAGKVLVPFGADPLYHHAYGGRIGADQRVVPIVWAEFGLKGSLDLDLDPIGLRIDAFVLRGYALRDVDGQLDLQTSGAPLDDLNQDLASPAGRT